MENNNPPYSITNNMINLVSEIMLKIGEANCFEELNKFSELRRKIRIRSIYSSLAIENNGLSLKLSPYEKKVFKEVKDFWTQDITADFKF